MTIEQYQKQIEDKKSEIVYLQKQIANLQGLLNQNGPLLKNYEMELQKERADVENLDKTSISSLFNSITGGKDKKIKKEQEELFAAKVKYEELLNSVTKINSDLSRVTPEFNLKAGELKSLEELARREHPELEQKYKKKEEEIVKLKANVMEIREAMGVGNETLQAIDYAMSKLKAASNWATVDMFRDRGVLSHMAKYGNINEAQKAVNDISYLLEKFNSELNDISMMSNNQVSGLNMGNRFMDVFFDNIFTDMAAKRRIEEDLQRMMQLRNQVSGILGQLDNLMKNNIQKIENFSH